MTVLNQQLFCNVNSSPATSNPAARRPAHDPPPMRRGVPKPVTLARGLIVFSLNFRLDVVNRVGLNDRLWDSLWVNSKLVDLGEPVAYRCVCCVVPFCDAVHALTQYAAAVIRVHSRCPRDAIDTRAALSGPLHCVLCANLGRYCRTDSRAWAAAVCVCARHNMLSTIHRALVSDCVFHAMLTTRFFNISLQPFFDYDLCIYRYLLAHADPVLQVAGSRRYVCTRFASDVNNVTMFDRLC